MLADDTEWITYGEAEEILGVREAAVRRRVRKYGVRRVYRVDAKGRITCKGPVLEVEGFGDDHHGTRPYRNQHVGAHAGRASMLHPFQADHRTGQSGQKKLDQEGELVTPHERVIEKHASPLLTVL